jgi:hypothetical protein
MRNTNAQDELFEATAILSTLLAGTAFAMLLRQLISAAEPLLELMFSQLTMGTGL